MKILYIFCILVIILFFFNNYKELFYVKQYKILKLKNWYGRIGNNIITLSNALHVALEENYDAIIFPKNSYFNKTYIKLNECDLNTKNFIEHDSETFFRYNNKDILKKNKKLVLKHLTDLFKIKYESIPKGKYNDLYIHIRSGDLFSGGKCNNKIYCENQPDYKFYKNIIDSNNYEKIYIIAEDSNNPIINKLINEYPNIIYSKKSLEEDIKLIMGSRNIIYGYTTFVPTILYFNKGVKNVYRNRYVNKNDKIINNINKYNNYKEFIY